MQQLIFVHYRDVDEQGSRYGCGFYSEHREVKDIVEVEGGQRGIVRHRGKDVFVYRREDSLSEHWETRASVLGPIKVTKVSGGGI